MRFCEEGVEFFLGFDKVTHDVRIYLIEKPSGVRLFIGKGSNCWQRVEV